MQLRFELALEGREGGVDIRAARQRAGLSENRVAPGLVELHRKAVREGVVRPHHDADRRGDFGEIADGMRDLPDEGEPHVNIPRRNHFRYVWRLHRHHGIGHRRKIDPEPVDGARQEVDQQRIDRRDRDMAGARRLEIVNRHPHTVEIVQRIRDVAQQQFARDREPHAAGQAIEERRPQLVLEIEDLPVDRAGRDVER